MSVGGQGASEHVHSRPSTLFAIETRDALVRIKRGAFVHVRIDPFFCISQAHEQVMEADEAE